jgi:hypothetical protein
MLPIPHAARARMRLPTVALSLISATGLCSRIRPLSCASWRRSEALSPVIRTALAVETFAARPHSVNRPKGLGQDLGL